MYNSKVFILYHIKMSRVDFLSQYSKTKCKVFKKARTNKVLPHKKNCLFSFKDMVSVQMPLDLLQRGHAHNKKM